MDGVAYKEPNGTPNSTYRAQRAVGVDLEDGPQNVVPGP